MNRHNFSDTKFPSLLLISLGTVYIWDLLDLQSITFSVVTLTMYLFFFFLSANSLTGKLNETLTLALLPAFCHFEPIMQHKRFDSWALAGTAVNFL